MSKYRSEGKGSVQGSLKVIYLVGMGRSGSTLLDILLGSHSNIRALGGIRRLAHYARKHPCPCGAPSFWECEFWSEANRRLTEKNGRTLISADVHARKEADFRAENKAVFEAAAEAAGVEYVTDNSKSVVRLKRLMKAPYIDVIPIHVHRDARGRAQSIRKRKGQRYIPTFSYSHRSLRLYFLLRNKPHIAVDYEKLAADPEGELRKLMKRIGLEFEPQQLQWADMPQHNIGAADVLRKTDGSTIRPDDGWKTALPHYMQTIIKLIALPGRIANEAKARRWGL